MKTQAQLIQYCEIHLEKVISMNSTKTTCSTLIEKQKAYIEFAKNQLEAVKSGGLDGLMRFYDAHK